MRRPASSRASSSTTTSETAMASPVIMNGAITSKGLAAVAKLFNASKTARPPLLIATNVRLRKWLASGLDGRHFGVCLEGTYDRRCNPKDPSTRVSIFIVGNLGWKHQAGVSKMLGQLYRQQTATLRTYIGWGLYAGGGHVRRPDLLVLREDGAPCMILELDHKHRSLTQMAERLSGYLVAYTTMRMTIGVKLFGAQSGDPFRFAAVALQFGCDADGHPQLVYAASIGSAPLTPQEEADTRAAIGDEAFAAMDHFEAGVASEAALQHATWKYAAMDCPQLSIQMSDVVTSTVPDLAPTNERLVIDLYKVILACYEIGDKSRAIELQHVREMMYTAEGRASVVTEVVANQDVVNDHHLAINDTDAAAPLTPPGLQLSIHDLLCVPRSFVAEYVRVANEQQVLDDVANAGAALDELYRFQTEQNAAFELVYQRDPHAVNDIDATLRDLETQINDQLAALSLLRDKIQVYAAVNHNVAQEFEGDSRAQIKLHLATLETILVERLALLLDGQNPRVQCAGTNCWPAFATALD